MDEEEGSDGCEIGEVSFGGGCDVLRFKSGQIIGTSDRLGEFAQLDLTRWSSLSSDLCRPW